MILDGNLFRHVATLSLIVQFEPVTESLIDDLILSNAQESVEIIIEFPLLNLPILYCLKDFFFSPDSSNLV